ncbi:MAG: glycerol dehydrogenase [Opitutales bacterium]
MITATIFPGRYIQGSGAIDRLGDELTRLGGNAFMVADPFAAEKIVPGFERKVGEKVRLNSETFGGECSDEEIGRLAAQAREAKSDLIAGIGGGKTLDTAKAVAHQLNVPVAIIPTIASTDAPCSALSVIYTPEGEVQRYLFLPKNPDVVLVDSEIIAQAPVRFLVAGMGDALSTWFEARACQRAYAKNVIGEHGSMTAYGLAGICYHTLLEHGLTARIACESNAVVPALERIIETNTLLSGIGFESGGLGACHAIHNGLTVLPETHNSWHGEKVAIGVLTSLFLSDKPREMVEEVYAFCLEVGLPLTLEQIGISEVTDEKLFKVAERACAEGETIHNEPEPVTPQKVVAALKTADATGRIRMLAAGK